MPTIYPLDQSGSAASNLVTNELHSVNEGHFRDHFFIVPNVAPFFVTNFVLTITINNVTSTLVEDVDFAFVLPYITGTRVTGKPMYGGLTLHNLDSNGILSIQYQTIGGDQVVDKILVLTFLADKAYNPRTTIWDIITNVPNAFPPVPHFQDYDQFFGQEEVVTGLNLIRDAIIQNATITQTSVFDLLNGVGLNTDFVQRGGDSLTGFLILHSDPTLPLHASTKQYVDTVLGVAVNAINATLQDPVTKTYVDNNDALKVNKTGDTLTGFLTVHAAPTAGLHVANKTYVDNLISTVQSTVTTLETMVINDYALKSYVDAKILELRDDMLSLLAFSEKSF